MGTSDVATNTPTDFRVTNTPSNQFKVSPSNFKQTKHQTLKPFSLIPSFPLYNNKSQHRNQNPFLSHQKDFNKDKNNNSKDHHLFCMKQEQVIITAMANNVNNPLLDDHDNEEAERRSLSSSTTIKTNLQQKTSDDHANNKNKASSSSSSGSEMNGRERLKRHRVEMAGRVWIPEIWGQEDFLKDWIDCSAFDACLGPKGLMSAKASLIEEAKRATTGGLRIENRC